MVQAPSVGQTVRDWVVAHGYVDLGLQVVVLAVFLLVTLFAVSGALYWLWWLIRLSRAENVATFTAKEIPGLRKGKVAGQEFEFGEVNRREAEALRLGTDAVAELSFRLTKLEGAFERFEDVSGRA